VAGLLTAVALVALVGAVGIAWAYEEAVRQRKLAGEEADRSRQEARRADDKATEAKFQAEAATRARDESRLQTYIAEIGRVDAQLQAGNYGVAHEALERTALDLRGWEYHYLRNRTNGTPLTLRGHTGEVLDVSYSPDGSRIASASSDRTIKVWDARTGAEILTLRGHTRAVHSVEYSPDGSRLASASETEVKV
jgi:hypothetical protein